MKDKNYSARTRTVDCWNAHLLKDAEYSKDLGLPLFKSASALPHDVISFKNISPFADTTKWVHFYASDNRLESVYESPEYWAKCLSKFDGIISPDLSVYYDDPISVQFFNTFRNRTLAYWFAKQGIPVIPNVRWGKENSYSFCFDGIEKNGAVCVSTCGVLVNKKDREIFRAGFDEMIKQLTPNTIIVYGQMPSDIFSRYLETDISFLHFNTDTQKAHDRGVA